MERAYPNWVAERAKCNLDVTFTTLTQIVKRDVAEMMNIPSSQREGREFRVDEKENGHPIVEVLQSHELKDREEALCSFMQHHDAIIVSSSKLKAAFKVIPRWGMQTNQCRFVIQLPGEEDCEIGQDELWKISRKVLGPLFFEC